MNKNEMRIGKLIGRIDNDYYVCNYLFEYPDGLKGATATVLRPVGKDEYEIYQDPGSNEVRDRLEELWVEQVKAGQTQEGLSHFCECVVDNDGDNAFWDYSGYEFWGMLRDAIPELTEEDYPCFDCVGGGRSFRTDMEWNELYDAKIWALIQEYEAE